MDKELEYLRYNKSSAIKINKIANSSNKVLAEGSEAYPSYLNTPYQFYEKLLSENVHPGTKVLDLCCGDGIHTLYLARLGAKVTAVDIAENSIKLAELRADYAGVSNIKFIAADVENLPFSENDKFDIITCVGSLSYIDLNHFITNVIDLLVDGGKFICVDSYNHNPIYRLNRYIHYLKGERTLSTLNRMPNNLTIRIFKMRFQSVKTNYFGIFAFAGLILTKLLGQCKAKKIIDGLDKRLAFMKKFSFKIVIIATK
jgi:ubiquinone/menaquinone biosynthesis C-methylase UbiE